MLDEVGDVVGVAAAAGEDLHGEEVFGAGGGDAQATPGSADHGDGAIPAGRGAAECRFLPAGARLRDAGVRSPDFVVIGNGRVVVVEVDGPHHFGATRKADDHTRDRHWGTAAAPAPSVSRASTPTTWRH